MTRRNSTGNRRTSARNTVRRSSPPAPQQAKVANAYIAQLTAAKVFPARIVTKVEPLKAFYPAEGYHQNYLAQHPNEPYIVYNDAPKLVHLKAMFPTLYRGG